MASAMKQQSIAKNTFMYCAHFFCHSLTGLVCKAHNDFNAHQFQVNKSKLCHAGRGFGRNSLTRGR